MILKPHVYALVQKERGLRDLIPGMAQMRAAVELYDETIARGLAEAKRRGATPEQLAKAKNTTRRQFLKGSTAAAGGLVIGFHLPGANRIANAQAPAAGIPPTACPST